MNFQGAINLRPVRVGFLVPPNDLDFVRKVIQLSCCVWGGRYNPIIPYLVEAGPQRLSPFRDLPGRDVTRGYIDFFEPDLLVEGQPGMAEALGWGGANRFFRLPRVLPLHEFYKIDTHAHAVFHAGIDIVNVMQELYDREYKYERRHKIPYVSVEETPGNLFFDAVLGAYPADNDLGHIRAAYREIFEPTALACSAETGLRIMREQFAGPLRITRHQLEESHVHGGIDYRIFVFDPTNAADVVEYWNFRLVQKDILPVNWQWLKEYAPFLRERITACYRPIPGNPFGTHFMTALGFGRSINDAAIRAVVEEHFSGLPDHSFATSRAPAIWAHQENRGHVRETRIVATAKTEAFDVETSSEGYVRVPSIEPSFRNAIKSYVSSHWVNVVVPSSSRFNQDAALVYPTDLWKPSETSRQIKGELLVTREGWAIPQEQSIGYMLLKPTGGRDAIIRWFRDQGIQAIPSEEGQVAAQVISAAGNLMSCGMFADADTLKLLNSMAESVVERPVRGTATASKGPDRAKPVALIKNHFDRREKVGFGYWNKLDFFLERSVFRAGVRVQCPVCANHNWYDLKSFDYNVTCSRCLKPFEVGQTPKAINDIKWYYRVIGPYAAPGYARGGYAVALTLRRLSESMDNDLTWSTGLKLKELDREIDFAVWHRREGSVEAVRRDPEFVVGEVKSFGKDAFTDDDVDNRSYSAGHRCGAGDGGRAHLFP